MSDYYDVLIIGQGLAGSLLAYELIQRQISVLVVDNGLENASQIAAGLMNPITGMRLVKSPETERMLIEARRYYQQLSALFQQPFYIEKPMWRVFQTQQEYGYAVKRLKQADYGHYLGQLHSEADKPWFHHAYGFIEQQQTGYLLTKALLTALKAFFYCAPMLSANSVRLCLSQF
ncbi:FAD-dependent oxidoreductase [Methylocucumis oryzae]|uniref:FAD-dependent oxidoreductase n=1 Tax=Methylocucumis oryzae TaxID=1632867 RepID=UPI001EF9EFAE|nr:FAD-dependent oxidoreductase [Methylocucumis oryzae]